MTKGALPAFARSLAIVGGPDRIRVNVICPGPVDTPMLPEFFGRDPGTDIEALLQRTLAKIPMGRVASVDEIAGAVAFLASSDSGYITGVTLPLDGGRTIT